MSITQKEYDKLIADVETQFGLFLAKSESEVSETLVKNEESQEAKEESKDEPKAEEKKDESEEKKDDAEKKDDDHCDYDDEDMEEMHKMYGTMSKGELKAHKDSIDKCWMAKCGEMTQMAKSEQTVSVEIKTEEKNESEELLKTEVTTLKKENEDLKKNVEGLVLAMNQFLAQKQPARKAVTDISFISKSEEVDSTKTLSKSEITKILVKKASDPQLSKSDRELINSYYNQTASVEQIRHLLK